MQVVFPMSMPTASHREVPHIHVSFADCFIDPVSTAYTTKCALAGSRIIQFGGRHLFGSPELFAWDAFDFETLVSLNFAPRGIVVYPYAVSLEGDWSQAYELAARDPRVEMIAISCGDFEYSRVKFISHLVHSGKFCTKKSHWLYGFYNPAEISFYRVKFLPFIYSKINMAVCSSCFLYSAYGALLSEAVGVVESIPYVYGHRLNDLGMSSWVHYTMRREQLRGFQDNMRIVQSFARGEVVAYDYVEILAESMVEGAYG